MVRSAASIYPEHKVLVDAILSGDAALSEELASEYVTVHGQRLTETLRDTDQLYVVHRSVRL